MRVIDRFSIYMEAKRLNDNRVTKAIGLAIGTIGKARKEGNDLSRRVIGKILEHYTDLNAAWLYTGEGEMLNTSHAKGQNEQGQEQQNADETAQTVFSIKTSSFDKLIEQHSITISTINMLVREISKMNDLIAKSQEQLDKMIEIALMK